MAETKLILVEGLPGSGKTTTALFVADWLADQGVETAVYLEGNLNHPADFESVACLDSRELAALQARFPAEAAFLEAHDTQKGNDHFFPYRLLEQSHPHLPDALIAALAQYEIYELPVEKYRRLLKRRWRDFAATAAAGDVVFVFECCFIQNPMTMLMGRNNETAAAAQSFILELAETVKSLSPHWLYLQPGDVRTTLEQVARQRPQEWLDFVIAYHTQQGHGLAQGWEGFDGLVSFYEMRRSVELALLPALPFTGLRLPHTNWPQNQVLISRFLSAIFGQ